MNNNTYTLFLPENEDGAVWSKKNMDKEAAILTIKLNINKDNMISNEIIKRNKNNILNMNINIKEIRTHLTNLSQAKFAKLFHIPLSTLSHWEQGQRTPPEYISWMIKKILLSKQ